MAKKIVVIDDELDIHEIYKEMLSELTDQFYFATNGEEGLALIRKINPDLIITDYNMPKMNGLQLLMNLDNDGCQIPIIWITGRGTPEVFQAAWDFGVFEFFEKPVDFERLKVCVRSALQKFEKNNVGISKDVTVRLSNSAFEKLKSKCEQKSNRKLFFLFTNCLQLPCVMINLKQVCKSKNN